jgi:hypothetical protein
MVCHLLGIDPLRLGALPTDPAAWALGPPRVAWAITPTWEKSRDAQQRELAACIPPALMKTRYHQTSGFHNNICVLTNGSRIVFKTAEQALETFESNAIHLAWIDENIPLSYIRATLVRLTDHRGPLWITVWPGYGDIVDLFLHGRAAAGSSDTIPEQDRAYLFAAMLDNPHLSPAEITLLEKMMPAHERLARVMGRPTQTRGLVYGDYRENLHCETFEPPLPADWTLYEAIDPGWANPCAVLFAAVDPRGVLHCYDEIYERYRTVGEIAAMIFLRRWLNRGLMLPAEVEQFQQLTKFDAFAEDPEEQIRRDAKLLGVVQQWRARKGDCKPRMVVIDEAGKQRDQAKPVSVLRQFERFGIRPELAKNADKDGQRDMVRERLRPMDGLIRLKLAWRLQWFADHIPLADLVRVLRQLGANPEPLKLPQHAHRLGLVALLAGFVYDHHPRLAVALAGPPLLHNTQQLRVAANLLLGILSKRVEFRQLLKLLHFRRQHQPAVQPSPQENHRGDFSDRAVALIDFIVAVQHSPRIDRRKQHRARIGPARINRLVQRPVRRQRRLEGFAMQILAIVAIHQPARLRRPAHHPRQPLMRRHHLLQQRDFRRRQVRIVQHRRE